MKPTISTMAPEAILRKPVFKRLLPADNVGPMESGLSYGSNQYMEGIPSNPVQFEVITPADCMREFDMHSHKIFSKKYYPNPISSKEVENEDGTTHKVYYERQLARVGVDLIQMFHTQRTSLLVGSNTDLRIVSRKATDKEKELFSAFREGWETKNMDNARYELISRSGKTMDAAICCYLDNGSFGWRAFSYEDGDTCYPHYNPATGRLSLFGRLYTGMDENGEEIHFLDVWDEKSYMRYREGETDKKGQRTWVRDMDEPRNHGFKSCPVAYMRYGEPFWGSAIHSVDDMELELSQLLENNKSYALRILVALGSEMSVEATMDGRPLQINGSADGKVNFLEPADASGSFTLSLSETEKQAYISANCVKQTEIKSGADMSSLTVKMLNQPAYRKAILDALKFQPAVDTLVELFKYGYAMELGRSSEFETFKVKARTYPYVMMSETEEVNSVVQLKGSGALSVRSAAEEAYNLGYGSVDEAERILQEQHDELVGMQPQTQQEASNTVANSRNTQ